MADNATKTTVNVFTIGDVLDPHVRIEGKCRACRGTGKGEFRAHCRSCGKTYLPERPGQGDLTSEQLQSAGDTLPCGHSWNGWIEGDACDACEGTGRATSLVRLSDLLTPLHGAEFVGTAEEAHP